MKPTTTINTLLATAITRLELVFGISTLVAVLLSFLVSLWMTSPIKRLTLLRRRYEERQADAVSQAGPKRDRGNGEIL